MMMEIDDSDTGLPPGDRWATEDELRERFPHLFEGNKSLRLERQMTPEVRLTFPDTEEGRELRRVVAREILEGAGPDARPDHFDDYGFDGHDAPRRSLWPDRIDWAVPRGVIIAREFRGGPQDPTTRITARVFQAGAETQCTVEVPGLVELELGSELAVVVWPKVSRESLTPEPHP